MQFQMLKGIEKYNIKTNLQHHENDQFLFSHRSSNVCVWEREREVDRFEILLQDDHYTRFSEY